MKKLTVLGSGDAFATGGRHTTAFLISDDKGSFLVDCGASTLVRLKQIEHSIDRIKGIFITHFHGDHFGGLPFVILSLRIEYGLDHTLFIAGPQGLEEKVRTLQDALYPETSRFYDELNIHFIEYNLNWQNIDGIEFKAVPVTHSPPSNPHGIQLRWNNQIFAFSGDTEWDDRLFDLSTDTSAFIVECNNYLMDSPGHLSLKTLMEKRELLKTQRLLLSHMGKEMLELEKCPFERLKDGIEITLW